MSDRIKRHVDGHKQTLRALNMVATLGYEAGDVAERLLYALAGKDSLRDMREVNPKSVKRLANKLRHAAGALTNAIHDLHVASLEVLQDARIIKPTPDKAPASLERPDAEDEMSAFVAEQMDDSDHHDLIQRVISNRSLYDEADKEAA